MSKNNLPTNKSLLFNLINQLMILAKEIIEKLKNKRNLQIR